MGLPSLSADISTYSLSSVINHHGSFFGGHYTAYSYKGDNPDDGRWVKFDDERYAADVDPAIVANSEAYVLIYTKRPLVQESPLRGDLREIARELLLSANLKSKVPALPRDSPVHRAWAQLQRERHQQQMPRGQQHAAAVVSDNDTVVYMSRLWLNRCASLCEPGVILNRMCYCSTHRRRHHQFAGTQGREALDGLLKRRQRGGASAGASVPDSSDPNSTQLTPRTAAVAAEAMVLAGTATDMDLDMAAHDLSAAVTGASASGSAPSATDDDDATKEAYLRERCHVHCSARWFYVPVALWQYELFAAVFGGGPAVDERCYRALLRREQEWADALQAAATP